MGEGHQLKEIVTPEGILTVEDQIHFYKLLQAEAEKEEERAIPMDEFFAQAGFGPETHTPTNH
jgi:hypothetical protein